MDYLALLDSASFINLHSPDPDRLPAVLGLVHQKSHYRGRLIHAEVGHYNKPLSRRPAPYGPLQMHHHYHFVLVTAGKGHFFIDGELTPAAPGRVFFTSPSQLHQFLNVGKDSTRYNEITFEMIDPLGKHLDLPFHELLSTWTNQPLLPPNQAPLPPATARLLERKMEHLVALGKTGASDLELNFVLSEILILLASQVFQRSTSLILRPLDAVRDAIHHRFRSKLNLADLARLEGLTPNYLSRRFRQIYGHTPIHYQIDLRIRAAREILKTQNSTLEEIASDLGFKDVSYFSRLFKKRTGLSPGRFRRK